MRARPSVIPMNRCEVVCKVLPNGGGVERAVAWSRHEKSEGRINKGAAIC